MTDRKPRRAPAMLRVGRFFGVPLYFAPSWILIATLITIMYSSIIRDLVTNVSTGTSYAAALGFAIALALCVLAHELGHVAVSLALGRPVRRVVIFLLGGVSEIEGEIDRARDEFLVALAGPVISGLLAGLLLGAESFTASGSLASALLGLLGWSNVIVALFNLLPGLPLDGGRVLRATVWSVSRSSRVGTLWAGWGGRAVAVLLVLSALVFVRQDWGFASGLLSVLLAAFIWGGATQALRAAAIGERVGTIRVADLLRPGLLVHGDVSLAEALRRAHESAARGIVITDSAGRPQAIVEEAKVLQVPVERQPWTPVGAVARSLEPGLVLPDSLASDDLIAAMRNAPATEYLVVHPDGSLAGIFAATDLATALSPGAR